MASHKLQAAIQSLEGEEMQMDISSMIDLVFLLIIFFMVSSHLIILKIDKRVNPPTAKNAAVTKNATGRIVVNVLDDGTVWIDQQNELPTSEAITDFVDQQRLQNEAAGFKDIKLHLRADEEVDTRVIKKVVQAAGEAGVSQIIFGSYVVER